MIREIDVKMYISELKEIEGSVRVKSHEMLNAIKAGAKLNSEISKAEESGESPSKITQYYQNKASVTVKGVKSDEEEFYQKVKNLLLTYGEVSDAIGRLTDKEYFSTLTYEQKQRYTLELSSKYLKAKERFYREIKFETV
jgi:hypothetical protein